MSRFKHNFQYGKKDPLRCSVKIKVENPDGDLETISCGEHRDSYIHKAADAIKIYNIEDYDPEKGILTKGIYIEEL